MRILLICANVAESPYAVYPLGMGVIAKCLEEAGHEVRQFDFLASGGSFDAVREAVAGFSPELVGVSIRNIDDVISTSGKCYTGAASEITKTVKETTSAPVAMGGSGFSLLPREILEASEADYGIIGEGETAFSELAEKLSENNPPENKIFKPERPCGSIGGAAYQPEILEFYLKRGGCAPIQTKRGCPRQCAYCSYPHLEGTKIRPRDPESVIADIELLTGKFPAKLIFFTDSVFNDDSGHYMEVVEAMREHNINFPWTAFFRPGNLNKTAVRAMRETGLSTAELGADAATNATLTALRKGFTFKEVAAANDLFAAHGVTPAHYFIFGGPGETKETVKAGIDNILQLDNSVSLITSGIRIFPGTQLYDRAIQEKIISPNSNLLEPAYYFSPDIEREWLEDTLHEAFSCHVRCIYPPDAMDDKLKLLHQLGHSGMAVDLLVKSNNKRRKS